MKYFAIIVFAMWGTLVAQQSVVPELVGQSPVTEHKQLSEVISEVSELVEKHYYRDVEPKHLFAAFMHGLRAILRDRYVEYLDEKEHKYLVDGKFIGIGVMISHKNNILQVLGTFAGSPAQEAGLNVGDQILAIDGEKTAGHSLEKLLKRMKGPKDSAVVLSIYRPALKKNMQVSLVRKEFVVQRLFGRLVTSDIGYIKVEAFTAGSGEKVREMCEQLQKKKIKGLIFDLRGCPGGHLKEVLQVADGLMGEGVVLKIKKQEKVEEIKSNAGVWFDLPMVVLVNGSTASATEILVGALKERGRSLIIGTKTFGKGTIQKLFPLKAGGALKLTTAIYLTPKGNSVEKTGIAPDVYIAHNPKQDVDVQLKQALSLVRALITLQKHK